MARTTGSDGEKTEAAVREAAVSLIARFGYEAMSMRQLAAEVGVQAAVGRFNPKTAAKAGAPMTVGADASAFHFFDPDTRNSIW